MKTSRQPTKDEGLAAFIGMDWADQKHDVCLWAADSGKSEALTINHLPETLREWINGLRERFGGRRIAICLEQSKGPLIHALMGYEFLVLYPINPRTLAKYRETFSLSRAKDDPTDAALALELLRKHRDKLRAWKPDDEQTRFMGRLVEDRRKESAPDPRAVLSINAFLRQQVCLLSNLQIFPSFRLLASSVGSWFSAGS